MSLKRIKESQVLIPCLAKQNHYLGYIPLVESRLQLFKRLKQEREILSVLSKYGIPKSHVIEVKSEFADRKPEAGVNYYYYNGPLDAKTRKFCRLMLKIDKVFSEEEINKVSDELGYPVLEYCGSYGCRHQWIRFRGNRIYTPKPTVREIRKLINDGIESESK